MNDLKGYYPGPEKDGFNRRFMEEVKGHVQTIYSTVFDFLKQEDQASRIAEKVLASAWEKSKEIVEDPSWEKIIELYMYCYTGDLIATEFQEALILSLKEKK